MSRADWRSPDAYEHIRSLDASGFAWEFLRRNPVFRREHRKLEYASRRGTVDSAETEAFAHRWGVRFRESEQVEEPGVCPLDSLFFAQCRCFDTASCRLRRS